MTAPLHPVATESTGPSDAAQSDGWEAAGEADAVGNDPAQEIVAREAAAGESTTGAFPPTASPQAYLEVWARARRGGRPPTRVPGRTWGALGALAAFTLLVVAAVIVGMIGLPAGDPSASVAAPAIGVSRTRAASPAAQGSPNPGRTAPATALRPTTPAPSTPPVTALPPIADTARQAPARPVSPVVAQAPLPAATAARPADQPTVPPAARSVAPVAAAPPAVPQQAAPAAPAASASTLTDLATGFCLESNSSQSGYAGTCNGSDSQRWKVYGYGAVVLTDLATGYCLDSNTVGNAYTRSCQGAASQQWRTADAGYGTVSFTNVATGRCLDSGSDGSLYTMPCNGGSYQRWARG
ncbi:Ricin-type beta-trefoil lectin domain-containing protein [Frankia sp. AiPs1]|uniref:RICIN domain-containing protein n=1 Tax=Frankia sp. AiPa1 TaxID=573492 RepID=UPI00202AD5D6|nr:RICIN domain-containing protein [Frankia sp. AiPa1]MCL9760813.1 ricin-type beta-trefoil lectin domain protein [Frankia sp. AiPa1]